jgi:hypothetical protein
MKCAGDAIDNYMKPWRSSIKTEQIRTRTAKTSLLSRRSSGVTKAVSLKKLKGGKVILFTLLLLRLVAEVQI